MNPYNAVVEHHPSNILLVYVDGYCIEAMAESGMVFYVSRNTKHTPNLPPRSPLSVGNLILRYPDMIKVENEAVFLLLEKLESQGE